MKALTILYHDVVEDDFDTSGFPGAAAARYKLRTGDFEDHLRQLQQAAQQNAGSVDALIEGSSSDVFLFTVDDGGSCAPYIADQLERRGWCGHFFITTGEIGHSTFVNEEQIRDLRARGHVIGSHSVSHPHRMAELPEDELFAQWDDSIKKLSDILGEAVASGSVPGGFYRKNVAVAAKKAGIKALFTSEPTTGVEQMEDCLILGRYNVYRGMSARAAAALIGKPSYARLRQQMEWNGKKVLKSVAAPVWDRTRELVFGQTGR